MGKSKDEEVAGWGDIGGGRTKAWHEGLERVNLADIAKDKYVQLRLVTLHITEAKHWIYMNVKDYQATLKGKTFKPGEVKSYPSICPDVNPRNGSHEPDKCPICLDFAEGFGKPQITYYAFAYYGTQKKSGKVAWSDEPVLVTLSKVAAIGIKNVTKLPGKHNRPHDAKEGYTINIMYDSSARNAISAWVVQPGEAMPLTKEQRLAVKELPDLSELFTPGDPKEIKSSLKQKGYYKLVDADSSEVDEDDEDEDEDDRKPSKKSKKSDKKSASKKSSRYDDDDDDEDEDEDGDDDEDEDEDERKPSKKSKKPAKSSKKSSRDEDEDEDEDDEDEDDVPPRLKKDKGKPSKSSKKSSRYDDEDEDEDDEDEDEDDEDEDDDEDERKPSKKSAKSSGKLKKPSDRFNVDDDEDEDDEDEGEDDEDEDDDEDDEDDEDEDERKPSKKSKKTSKKSKSVEKPKKKKKK